MSKVKLLVNTYYKQPLRVGDEIEVAQEVAERWERFNIATIVDKPKKKKAKAGEDSDS